MGIFSKVFKKKKEEFIKEEVHNEGIQELLKEEEKAQELRQEVVEEKNESLEEVLTQAQVIRQLEIPVLPVNYENFLESGLVLKVPMMHKFTQTIVTYKEKLRDKDKMVNEAEELFNKVLMIDSQFNQLKEEVYNFRKKDQALRKKIMDYTQVVKQINEKKLQGEEFEKVKQALTPRIQAVNQERDMFLKEEQEINERLKLFNQQMIQTCKACQQLAEKIK